MAKKAKTTKRGASGAVATSAAVTTEAAANTATSAAQKAAGMGKGAAEKSTKPIKVRATMAGYYDHARRREGDVFVIAGERDFSQKWMERVPSHEPEKVTTGQQVIDQQHDEVLREKMASRGGTGAANPLGAE